MPFTAPYFPLFSSPEPVLSSFRALADWLVVYRRIRIIIPTDQMMIIRDDIFLCHPTQDLFGT